MGLVLAFETTPRTISRPSAPRRAPVEGAAILFFTGVRYERQDMAEASQQTPAPEESADPQPAS